MPTIAVVGASTNRNKYGNKAVRAYARCGYTVFPIHPQEQEIEGWRAYPSIREIPVTSLDRVSIYLPPEIGLQVIDEIAQKPAGEVWLNPGAESPELIRRCQQLGLNVIAGCSIVDVGVSPEDL